MTDEEAVSAYIEKMYDDGMASNLSMNNRKKYAQAYTGLVKENVHFYPSCLKENDALVFFDKKRTADMLAGILKDADAYYSEWKSHVQAVNAPAYGKNIYIANGARITGLASSYRDVLINAGYTVTGIGNYDEAVLSDTKILVREEGTGNDLLQYFHNAVIETAELPDGIDIEIILGTNDAV